LRRALRRPGRGGPERCGFGPLLDRHRVFHGGRGRGPGGLPWSAGRRDAGNKGLVYGPFLWFLRSIGLRSLNSIGRLIALWSRMARRLSAKLWPQSSTMAMRWPVQQTPQSGIFVRVAAQVPVLTDSKAINSTVTCRSGIWRRRDFRVSVAWPFGRFVYFTDTVTGSACLRQQKS
jgi:hypothetical protein